METDANIVSGKTLSGTGTLSVTNLDATLSASFANVNPTTLNVDWSGTGTQTYLGNLTNVDTLTVTSGTMQVDANILNVATTITNSSTISITNLEVVPSMNLTKITGGTVNADWSGTATFTGNLSSANLVVSSGTMTVSTGTIAGSGTVSVSNGATISADASKLTGDTISGAGTVTITNLQSTLDADFTNITATTVNATWVSGTGTYTGNLTNVDLLTISSGTMTVSDNILGTRTVNGTGNLIVNADDASINLSNVNATLGTVTINDSTSDINIIGSAGDDVLNLSSGTDVVNLGASNDTINVADMSNLTIADTITDTSGTDTLNINGSGTIASTEFNVTGFENLNFSSGADTVTFTDKGSFDTWIEKFGSIDGKGNTDTLSFSDAVTEDLDFSKLNNFETLTFSANNDTVTFGSDEFDAEIRTLNLGDGTNIANLNADTTSAVQVNGGANDDTFNLDFSRLSEGDYNINGGSGTDGVKVSGTYDISSDMDFASSSRFTNIESLDISGMTLTSANDAEYTLTDSLITSWLGSSSNLTLKLHSNQAEFIKFTGNKVGDDPDVGNVSWDNDTINTISQGDYNLGTKTLTIDFTDVV
jgi:hypothetical protein